MAAGKEQSLIVRPAREIGLPTRDPTRPQCQQLAPNRSVEERAITLLAMRKISCSPRSSSPARARNADCGLNDAADNASRIVHSEKQGKPRDDWFQPRCSLPAPTPCDWRPTHCDRATASRPVTRLPLLDFPYPTPHPLDRYIESSLEPPFCLYVSGIINIDVAS